MCTARFRVLYISFGHYCNDKCYLFLQAERDTRLSYRLDERYLRLIIDSGSFSYIGRENLWGDRDVGCILRKVT